MLLSSPSFSEFLNHMSTNPAPVPQPSPQVQNPQEQQQQQQQQQEQQARQPPKDVNPYGAMQQQQHQQIGMAMMPEQSVDFSNLTIEGEGGFNLQPQVFSVATPEMPAGIDATVLSGKSSNFVGEGFGAEEKVQAPVIERPAKGLAPEIREAPPLDPEFEADPEFELYHSSPAPASAEAEEEVDLWQRDVFGGIRPEKVLERYELVDAAEEEQCAVVAMERVSRMCERLEGTRLRIEELLDY